MREWRECPICGRKFQTSVPNKKYCSIDCYDIRRRKWKNGVGTDGKEGHRRCHDCGKPTTNYRCTECWTKLRREAVC